MRDANRRIYRLLKERVDASRLMDNTEKLWRIELGQCYKNYRASAVFAEKLMAESGLEDIRRLPFPADGATVYQDKTMPLAWEASAGKMTVVESPVAFDDPVAADFTRHPFHLIKGSESTPPGGVLAKLITEEQMFSGEDARGAMVISSADGRDKKRAYRAACEFGAMGIVNDWLGTRHETPDALHWVNGWTEGPHWHLGAGDRRLIGFSVSPRVGDMLRLAAGKGQVLVEVFSDGRNFEGEIEVVTGTVKGEDERELWLLAHLYEPLSSDNSTGVVCAVEAARLVKKLADEGELPPLKFTLRLVFGLEMYGFAAYADSRGGHLGGGVVGALNLDGIPVAGGRPVDIILAPPPAAFAGDCIAEELAEDCAGMAGLKTRINGQGGYSDDLFLNDSTTGVPTVWFRQKQDLWHNSLQTMDIIDGKTFASFTAFAGAWISRMVCPEESSGRETVRRSYLRSRRNLRREAERILAPGLPRNREAEDRFGYRLEREERVLGCLAGMFGGAAARLAEEKAGLLREYAARAALPPSRAGEAEAPPEEKIAGPIFPRRVTVGMPYDLSRAPLPGRRILPDRIIYGPLARVLANADGRKSLARLAAEARWEEDSGLALAPGIHPDSEFSVKKCAGAVEYLTELGYLETRYSLSLGRKDIMLALEKAGIGRGDVVFVHTSLSGFGHIEGGADTVIDAFLETLGREGTMLVPAFTRSFIYFDGICFSNTRPRPFDPGRPQDVFTGALPKAFLAREGVLRSPHPSHSVAGMGRLAAECVLGHGESDPPFSVNSPLGKLPEKGASIVWFGADLSSTTFFHLLEARSGAPYLAGAVCLVRDTDGSPRAVLTPCSVPGHRDFYSRPGERSRMYRELDRRGLEIARIPLGFGEVKAADAARMYSLGMEILAEDPAALLCEDRNCLFCARWRREMAGG